MTRAPSAGPPGSDATDTAVRTHRAHPDDSASAAPPDNAARGRMPRPDGVETGIRMRVAKRTPASVARRRGLRRLAVLLGTIGGIVWLVYLLLFSTVFGARSVEVVGAELLTADEVRAAAAVPYGQPLLRLDTDEVAGRIGALRAVHAVHVERAWPSTLTVRITERTPLAFIAAADGLRLVDAGGLEFATVATAPPDVPELHALTNEATVAGAAVLAVLAEPGREALRAEVLVVRAASPFDVQLSLRGERTVRWGGAAESKRKADVLAVLLSQSGTVYDVASPELPTIR